MNGRSGLLFIAPLLLTSCAKYSDFSLPLQAGSSTTPRWEWRAQADPVIPRGPAGTWDSVDVLNPSIIQTPQGLLNLYSGFDGRVWRTGAATSSDGVTWQKHGVVVDGEDYIAANGALVQFHGQALYYFQAGRMPQIWLVRQSQSGGWPKESTEVLTSGPYGSWDERGVADPYVIEAGGKLYMYYLGMDRARRQRLGVAVSEDGTAWSKLLSNPVMEPGDYGSFDQNGLGEPAVWASHGFYWMLYTGRARNEQRRLGLAQSLDGVAWKKIPTVFQGDQPWNSQVLCDPTVLVEGDRVRVWFGGGDLARPDENIHGQIGLAVLTIQ